MSEKPVTTHPEANVSEPARAPLKLVVIIGLVLIALLIFGAMDR